MSTVTAGIETHLADIEVEVNGACSRFSVAAAVEVAFEPIGNPVTGAEHHVSVNLPTGMLTKREHYYSTKAFSVNAGSLSFAYPGRNAIASAGNWRGP